MPRRPQKKRICLIFYLPLGFGAGGLFPLPPPEGLPVVLGAFTGFVFPLLIDDRMMVFPTLKDFRSSLLVNGFQPP